MEAGRPSVSVGAAMARLKRRGRRYIKRRKTREKMKSDLSGMDLMEN
jgi:hypothetical protein